MIQPSEQKLSICKWSDLVDRQPYGVLVANVDLVVVRYDDQVSVLYGRCPHRGGMLADGRINGENLICGLHDWDFRFDTGVSEYNNEESIHKFAASVDLENDCVVVNEAEIRDWEQQHPQPFQRDQYLGQYADPHGADEEPYTNYIQQLARDGLRSVGHHGPVSAISPPRFAELSTVDDFRRFAEEVRQASGGIPIGFKMSAQHIEDDIDFALEVGVNYIILDGRGGGTGAAPNVFKNNISVATIPALARARRHLDQRTATDVTLIITGGLRTESDFLKALALGADGIAIANSAMQAIGCLGMRACQTNNCPVGIATQKDELRKRLRVQTSAVQLQNFLQSSVELMKVMSRACGHDQLSKLSPSDLTTYKKEMSELSGVRYAGVS